MIDFVMSFLLTLTMTLTLTLTLKKKHSAKRGSKLLTQDLIVSSHRLHGVFEQAQWANEFHHTCPFLYHFFFSWLSM
jgi:hypothetical protein